MRGNCGECNRRWACDIDPRICDEWPDSVPMTNAERIRAMSDEELAIMFAMLKADMTRLDRPVRKYSGRDVNDNYDWLQQPAGEA